MNSRQVQEWLRKNRATVHYYPHEVAIQVIGTTVNGEDIEAAIERAEEKLPSEALEGPQANQ